jgi:hypothetical protein
MGLAGAGDELLVFVEVGFVGDCEDTGLAGYRKALGTLEGVVVGSLEGVVDDRDGGDIELELSIAAGFFCSKGERKGFLSVAEASVRRRFMEGSIVEECDEGGGVGGGVGMVMFGTTAVERGGRRR